MIDHRPIDIGVTMEVIAPEEQERHLALIGP